MKLLQQDINSYLERVAPMIEPTSHRQYRLALNRFAREVGDKELSEQLVNGWLLDMVKVHKYSPNYALLYRNTLSAFFKWRGQQLINNQSRIVFNPKVPVPFEEDEYRKLLAFAETPDALDAYGDYWPYAIRMGWWTGLRISDVAKATWANVIWESKSYKTVPWKTRRRGSEVEIPLPDEMMEFLLDRQISQPESKLIARDMDFLWETNPGKGVFYKFRHLAKAAGLPSKKTFHCLRHGFVTRTLARGVPAAIVCKITGQGLETMNRYNQPTIAMKRKALGY